MNQKTGSEEECDLEVYSDRRKLHMSTYLHDVHHARQQCIALGASCHRLAYKVSWDCMEDLGEMSHMMEFVRN